jgi:transcriptional regulator with XRE-family HTH domain
MGVNSMAREENPGAGALFASELKAARLAAGWSRADLAKRLSYSESMVGLVENGHRASTLDFAQHCDEAFGSQERGTFVRLQRAAKSPLPSWFRPWAETEQVTARMARQSVLTRDGGPPVVWAVIDEAVLERPVGGAKVMHDQLLHLARMADQPNITVQVIPKNGGAHCCLAGAFAVAESQGATAVVYLETVTDGFIADSLHTALRVTLKFETLRSEALTRTASRELILRRAEEHEPD